MPSHNTVKLYVSGGYYHAYTRGVEKRLIFLDDQDHRVFLSFLRAYLSPPSPTVGNDLDHPLAKMTGSRPVNARKYPYSSYPYYLRLKQATWMHPEHVLDYFRSAQRKDYKDILSYESFVEDYGVDSSSMVGKLAID